MDLKQLIDRVTEIKAALAAEAKDAFSAEFEQFFAQHPDVYGFVWEQYTPHFNDGEPCEFGRHEIRVIWNVDGVEELDELEDSSYDGETGAVWDVSCLDRVWDGNTRITKNRGPFPHLVPAVKKFVGELASAPDDIFKDLGEGRVLVTRRGINVDYCDHS